MTKTKPAVHFYRNERIHDYIQLASAQLAFCYEGQNPSHSRSHHSIRSSAPSQTILHHFHKALDIYHTAIQLIMEEINSLTQSSSQLNSVSDSILLQLEEYTRLQQKCICRILSTLKTVILYSV